MSMFVPPVVIEIMANAREAVVAFREVNESIATTESHAKRATAAVGGLKGALNIAAAAAAFAAGVGVAKQVVEAYKDVQSSYQILGQAMANAGQSSEENRAKLEASMVAMENLGFKNETAAKSYATLVTAVGDTNRAMDIMAMSADLARTKGIGLDEASSILAKATQGSTRAFKELGISLDTTLPRQEAIAKAFDILRQKIAGQAVGYTKTLAGQTDMLAVNMEGLAESVGSALLPVMTILVDLLKDFIENALKPALKWVGDNAGALAALAGVLAVVVAGYLAVRGAIYLTTIAQAGLDAVWAANPVGLVIAALLALGAAFVYLWNTVEWFRNGVVSFFQGIIVVIWAFLQATKDVMWAIDQIPGVSVDTSQLDKVMYDVTKFGMDLDKLKGMKIDLQPEFKLPEAPKMGGWDPNLPQLDGAVAKTESAADKIASIFKKFQDDQQNAWNRYYDSVADASQKFNEARVKAEQDFADRVKELRAQRNKDLQDAAKEHQQKMADIEKDGAAKLQAIVQESMDRLRNAWKNGMSFNVGDMFKEIPSVDYLGQWLTDKLAKAKSLAQNATALAQKGFSQTFIEQVVAQGGTNGNMMAEQLLNADPETISSIQNSFTEYESLVGTGMDALSKTMYEKSGLATAELRNMYADAQRALADELAAEQQLYNDRVVEINRAFKEAYAKAKAERDQALKEAQKAYDEAIAAAYKQLTDDLIKASKALNDSLAEAKKQFISNVTAMKTAAIQAAAAIRAAFASLPGGGVSVPIGTTSGATTNTTNYNNNVTVNATTSATSSQIVGDVVYGINYGTPIK